MSSTAVASNKNLISKAIYLAWFTIIYNLAEGIVSIFFGLSDSSMALFGFGVDSFIEVASAFLVLWRFRGEVGMSQILAKEREKRATFLIGVLFLLLAVITAGSSLLRLFQHAAPESTLPGAIVSTISLSFMFFLWKSKRQTGEALDSSTILKDASCSLACIKLSVVLFLGSLIYLIVPSLWWVDSVAAILISSLILHEGIETVSATRKEDFDGGCCG